MCKSGKDSVSLAYTPKISELLPNYKIQCEQPCCEATFRNWGNYYMHLEKLHQLRDVPKRSFQQYHCPEKGCVYNDVPQPRQAADGEGKFFKSMKYLRQHYQKVHWGKRHTCPQCSKKFLTAGMLNSHVSYECGQKFSCSECACRFDSRAALQLHQRRQHCKKATSSRSSPAKAGAAAVAADSDRRSQLLDDTDKGKGLTAHHKDCATTTLLGAYADIGGFPPRTIETQTEHSNFSDWPYGPIGSDEVRRDDQPSMGISAIAHGVAQTDDYPQCEAGVQTDTAQSLTHMHSVATLTLPEDLEDFSIYLRHMETQTDSGYGSLRKISNNNNNQANATGHSVATTHEDLFTELGLVNMHTQTNLSSAEWPMPPPPPVVSSCAQDELLVSTETQTSFAQCLLDYGEANTTPDLQTTQYTQTCDFLLTSLFTTQYTQTCDDLLETIFDNEANDYIRDLDRSEE